MHLIGMKNMIGTKMLSGHNAYQLYKYDVVQMINRSCYNHTINNAF